MKRKASTLIPMTAFAIGLGLMALPPMSSIHAQQEQVYGRELMTERERNELRQKMQSAASNEEREQIRWEHHQKMQERAKQRGIDLPEEPMFGMRQRPGPGRGQGGGQGQLRLPKGGGGKRGG